MKVLLLIIGISGSGKSTLAKKIAAKYSSEDHSVTICSTDEYFMVNGEYKFDATKLGYYHKCNQDRVRDDMVSGVNVVIVDNTNLTPKERKPYIDIAKQYGYNVLAIEPTTDWKFDIDELTIRNNHNVPREAIQRMIERYVKFDRTETE